MQVKVLALLIFSKNNAPTKRLIMRLGPEYRQYIPLIRMHTLNITVADNIIPIDYFELRNIHPA